MISEADVICLVRMAIGRADSLRALAREWGVAPAYLSKLRHGGMRPGKKILDALGLERIVGYRAIACAAADAADDSRR